MSAPLVTPTDPRGRCQPPATAQSHTSCRWRCTRDSRRRGGRRGMSRRVRRRWRAWSRSPLREKQTASSSSTTQEICSRRRPPRREESAALRRSVKASGCEASGSVDGRRRPHRSTSTTDPGGAGGVQHRMCAAVCRRCASRYCAITVGSHDSCLMVEQLIWGFLTRAVTSAEGSVSRDLSVVAGAYGSWRPWWVRGLTDFVLICRMGAESRSAWWTA